MHARKRIVWPISSAKRLLPFLPLITALVLSLSGCAASATATMLPTSLPTSESKVHSMPAIYGFTHQNPDGNRYLKGQARLAQRSDPGYQAGRYAPIVGGGPLGQWECLGPGSGRRRDSGIFSRGWTSHLDAHCSSPYTFGRPAIADSVGRPGILSFWTLEFSL